jgi:hypothetical protein
VVSKSPGPVVTEGYTETEKEDGGADEGRIIEAIVVSKNPSPVDTEDNEREDGDAEDGKVLRCLRV